MCWRSPPELLEISIGRGTLAQPYLLGLLHLQNLIATTHFFSLTRLLQLLTLWEIPVINLEVKIHAFLKVGKSQNDRFSKLVFNLSVENAF
jgi:hypothetical protein